MSNKELKDLQESLDNYLILLNPKTCEPIIKNTLFDIQTAINAVDTKKAISLLRSFEKLIEGSWLNQRVGPVGLVGREGPVGRGQVGGHILIDLMNINDKVYKVHGLLLQSPSGNLYLYDPIFNGLTYFLPTNAANAPRAMRPEDKDKPLAYIDKVKPISNTGANPAAGPQAKTVIKPVANRVQGLVIPPVYNSVNTVNNAIEPAKPPRNGKPSVVAPPNQYDLVKVKEPNEYEQVGDKFQF